MTASARAIKLLVDLMSKAGLKGWDQCQAYMRVRGIAVEEFEALTSREASILINGLQGPRKVPGTLRQDRY